MSRSDLHLVRPTPFIDSEHPEVEAFARRHAEGTTGEVDAAVAVYYAVRDGIRYNPYGAALSVEGLRASTTLASGQGWCVAKAVLLAACYRSLGLPARLGFADVRNHLSTAHLRASMNTDVFYWHGYTSVRLGGRWVKATPAFNVELCEKFGFLPLDFDGRTDSLYHPFDREGRRHMEYVNERGEYDDAPLDEMLATFRKEYPAMEIGGAAFGRRDFDAEVEAEVAGNGRARASRIARPTA
jgi:transglutaminase-like putative cysteine protease